jgi:hypothetical protein
VHRKKVLENLVPEANGTTPLLSPLWQVIYQEAYRANHLIFDKDDLQKFDHDQSKFPIGQSDALAKTMIELFSCNDLTSLREYVCDLPYRRRRYVYLVYLRYLDSWRFQFRQGLN